MLKRVLYFAVLVIFSMLSINAANVTIDSDVYVDFTFYTYYLTFGENENYNSFSFEKPKDAKIEYALDNDGNTVKYSIAGDYFIFDPEGDTENKQYEIKFKSSVISQEVVEKHSYSNYVNFNFPVDILSYSLLFKQDFGEYSNIYPRNYVILDNGQIVWEVKNLEVDTFFLVNFGEFSPPTGMAGLYFWVGLFLGLVLLLIVIVYLYFYYNKLPSKSIKSPNEEKHKSVDEKLEGDKIDDDKFDEITSKYLTDNEREVVEVVKSHEGISQYDILNYVPSLTKSNLSKIISKLNSKKILKRIRVGKVNKIYIGDKLEKNNELD